MPAENSDHVWRVPPELEQSAPRRVRLNGFGIAYCIFSLASFVFGAGLSGRVVKDELNRQSANRLLSRRLASEGRESEATITRLFKGMGSVVSFEYAVDGRRYESNAFIAAEHWRVLQVGSPLAIRYLPSDPDKAYPDDDPPDSQNHWSTALPMAGMIVAFMSAFALIFLSKVLPERRLLAQGDVAQGVLTGCKAGSQGRSSGYFLNYSYSLPEGGTCEGKAFRGKPITAGSAVTVLYDRNRSGRSALYPLETVRLDVG